MWSRAIAVLLVVSGCAVLLGAAPANAQPPVTPTPPPPLITPDTSGCPNQLTPPPPVDLSEVPAPGAPVPAPLPVPEHPVGGPRMGECGLVLPGGAPAPPDGISATSWLVANGTTGEVLAAKDPHGRHRPASTIKLLTALLAADRLPADQVVVATPEDANQEGSRAGLGPGGQYTVRQLLTGLLLVSGNDAAHALAGQLGGMPATLEQMNALAARLGAWDTRAASASGLDGPGMSTSAYDLALVFRQVMRHPMLAEVLSTPQVRFPGFGDRPGFVLSNDNKLLLHYPGALGGKTGFTDDARHTYIGAAVRDGRALLVVLMRGEQHPVPMWEQAARLLDYGFALPRGRSVGVLVEQAPLLPDLPAVTLPEPSPADATTGPGHASGPAGGTDTTHHPNTLLATSLLIGLPTLMLVILSALLLRQRRRLDP
jgi:serine-type D-Ala-D-Ala carboxypeptidase (penicillin-binding protein 5/6)